MADQEHPPIAGRCLVVEDDRQIADIVALTLGRHGFVVKVVHNGEDALEACRSEEPDVVILDHGLPGINGQETASRLREFSQTYVLMLTAQGDAAQRVVALSTTADDYMSKPFSPAELAARVSALLRRPRSLGTPSAAEGESSASGPCEQVRRIGNIEVDYRRRYVLKNGVPLSLTRLEFDLLAMLVEADFAAVSRRELMERGWGDVAGVTSHSVDVHMHNLRKKLADVGVEGFAIETVRGLGFRVVDRSS